MSGASTPPPSETPQSAGTPPVGSSPPPPRTPRASWGPRIFKFLKILTLVTVVLVVVALVVVHSLIVSTEAKLQPKIENFRTNYRPPQVTRILARDGSVLSEIFVERRTIVPLKSLPPHVKLSFLAAEDANFYEHEGLNYFGMLRAFAVNLKAGRTRQGASTITQQVVKNILLVPERTYKRKFHEAVLARKLEQELTKDEIFELYLNHIYFGGGRYGIEEAAQFYFGKHAKELSIAEAALLAGLPAGPEYFSPRHHLERSVQRRRFVLAQMVKKQFLDSKRAEEAKNQKVVLHTAHEAHTGIAPEVVSYVRKYLKEHVGEGYTTGGYTVETTIDPSLQKLAREAVRTNLVKLDKRLGAQGPFLLPKGPSKSKKKSRKSAPSTKEQAFQGKPKPNEVFQTFQGVVKAINEETGIIDINIGDVPGFIKLSDWDRYNPKKLKPSEFAEVGALIPVSFTSAPKLDDPTPTPVPLRLVGGAQSALVAIDSRSHEVLALVGSYEGISGALDRATQAKRQPGSTFKPIVYSYALQQHRATASTLFDAGRSLRELYRSPKVASDNLRKPIRLREGLAASLNPVALQVMGLLSPKAVVQWAHDLGIESHLGADLSLALGSYEVAPLEMATAYSTISAGGLYSKPRIIKRVLNAGGTEVATEKPVAPKRVMDEATSYLITNLLSSVVDHGTATGAKQLKRPVVGKTGTTNKAKDAWFVGFSSDIVCAVWTGHDDARPLRQGRETGASAALPAWVYFMKLAHKDRPIVDFPRPSGLITVRIDPATGLRAYDGQTDAIDELFLPGTAPSEPAPDPDAGTPDGTNDAGDRNGEGDGGTIPNKGPEPTPNSDQPTRSPHP
jgi:penicillin-binding protein 1A